MARPLSRPGLGSTTRRELCWWLAQGETKESAAAKAGLPNSNRVHGFARTTEFANELREAMRDHLSLNLAPRAVATLKEIMDDKKVQPRVRVDAARILLDRAGYPAIDPPKKAFDSDDLASMTTEELQQIAAAGMLVVEKETNRRAEKARVIEPSLVEAALG